MRVLAGDIGGTSTRLALYEGESDALTRTRFERYSSRRYPDLSAIVREMLGDGAHRLDRAGFGIAGPIVDRACRATNLPWVIEADALARELAIPRVELVNDFHAIALGIAELGDDDVVVLQDQPVDADGPLAIIGAGTGLGEAFVIPGRGILPSEGGHVDLAPRDETEIDLLKFLMKRHERVSVERVVSGPGLHALYDFLVETGRARTSDALRARVEREDPGAVIGEAGVAGTDEACARAVEMFVSFYGSEAGDTALKVLPTGGVYIAGGIAPKLVDRMTDGTFLRAFLRKGRMSYLLEEMRVQLVMNTGVGLLGARAAALAP